MANANKILRIHEFLCFLQLNESTVEFPIDKKRSIQLKCQKPFEKSDRLNHRPKSLVGSTIILLIFRF